MLAKHMSEGLSFESFGGLPEVSASSQTLYAWLKKYPSFLEAKKTGQQKCMLFWEKMGRAGSGGKLPGFQNSAWIFNMKNRFLWRDRTDVVTTEVKTNTEIDLSDYDKVQGMIDNELAKRAQRKSKTTKSVIRRKSNSSKK